ncbi:MAG: hypothetical protein IKC36_05930, partial [Clostridia bacterium]|nr:hypothetical protein [Clostridia bacterium]
LKTVCWKILRDGWNLTYWGMRFFSSKTSSEGYRVEAGVYTIEAGDYAIEAGSVAWEIISNAGENISTP